MIRTKKTGCLSVLRTAHWVYSRHRHFFVAGRFVPSADKAYPARSTWYVERRRSKGRGVWEVEIMDEDRGGAPYVVIKVLGKI